MDAEEKVVATAKKTRVSNKEVPKTYTARRGDTLFKLAQKFYGDGSQYEKIRDANTDLINKHNSSPNCILPGDILTMPE